MILDIVNKMLKPIILIALISFISTWAFGIQNVMIQEMSINGMTIKVFNLRTYTQNLQNAWNTLALSFETILPTRTWDDTAAWNNWDGIFNNIAYVFDWVYFPINFILYLIRWIAWIINLGLSLIGWNTQPKTFDAITGDPIEYYSTLAQILNWVKINLMIPYV